MSHTRKPFVKLRPSENKPCITAIVLLILIGLSAAVISSLLITNSSGESLGISTDYLQYSPFINFFIPGCVLFIANGMIPLFIAGLIIKRNRVYRIMIFTQGVILCSWIVLEIIMLHSFNLLHIACAATGLAFIVIGQQLMALSARRRYTY